jgi:hypothetical protein
VLSIRVNCLPQELRGDNVVNKGHAVFDNALLNLFDEEERAAKVFSVRAPTPLVLLQLCPNSCFNDANVGFLKCMV